MKKSRKKSVIIAITLLLLAAIAVPGQLVHRLHARADALENFMLSSDYSPIIDSVTGDVDNDWFDEHCVLSFGPTSGLFTFTLTIEEFYGVQYKNTFCTEFYYLSFVESQDGTIQVRGETQGEDPAVHYFDISIEGGNVILSENGERLPWWGS